MNKILFYLTLALGLFFLSGCNPTPVEEQTIDGNRIILSKSYVESFKDKFADWQGQTN